MLTLATTASHAVVVFDNISAYQASTAGTTITSTGSTPNTFMGDAYTLAAGTTQITGFDMFLGNLSGTSFTGLKINFYVWGGVNTSTVNTTVPAFSSLLGSYSYTASGAFTTGFYNSFQNAVPGSAPGLALAAPLAVPGSAVGITINVQGTTDGVTYASFNSLSSMITTGAPATVGANVFNGYYRNDDGPGSGRHRPGVTAPPASLIRHHPARKAALGRLFSWRRCLG